MPTTTHIMATLLQSAVWNRVLKINFSVPEPLPCITISGLFVGVKVFFGLDAKFFGQALLVKAALYISALHEDGTNISRLSTTWTLIVHENGPSG